MLKKKAAYAWGGVLASVFMVLVTIALWGQVFTVAGASRLPDAGSTTSYLVEYQGGSINIIIGAAMLVLIVVGAWVASRQQSNPEA